jgi:hypothetical protein
MTWKNHKKGLNLVEVIMMIIKKTELKMIAIKLLNQIQIIIFKIKVMMTVIKKIKKLLS